KIDSVPTHSRPRARSRRPPGHRTTKGARDGLRPREEPQPVFKQRLAHCCQRLGVILRITGRGLWINGPRWSNTIPKYLRQPQHSDLMEMRGLTNSERPTLPWRRTEHICHTSCKDYYSKRKKRRSKSGHAHSAKLRVANCAHKNH